jgi:hypothetical protein
VRKFGGVLREKLIVLEFTEKHPNDTVKFHVPLVLSWTFGNCASMGYIDVFPVKIEGFEVTPVVVQVTGKIALRKSAVEKF